MSYKYKDEIKELVYNNLDKDLNKAFNMRDEINLVYAQTAKADEYEVKAKAYDRVADKLYARINHIIRTSHPDQRKPGYVDGLYNALDIISSELESGESE